MTLAGRIKRLEAQRGGAGSGLGSVVFEHDAKGDLVWAMVARWDGVSFPLERAPGEAVDTFGLRARALVGDLESAQAYVMAELRRVHLEA